MTQDQHQQKITKALSDFVFDYPEEGLRFVTSLVFGKLADSAFARNAVEQSWAAADRANAAIAAIEAGCAPSEEARDMYAAVVQTFGENATLADVLAPTKDSN